MLKKDDRREIVVGDIVRFRRSTALFEVAAVHLPYVTLKERAGYYLRENLMLAGPSDVDNPAFYTPTHPHHHTRDAHPGCVNQLAVVEQLRASCDSKDVRIAELEAKVKSFRDDNARLANKLSMFQTRLDKLIANAASLLK